MGSFGWWHQLYYNLSKKFVGETFYNLDSLNVLSAYRIASLLYGTNSLVTS